MKHDYVEVVYNRQVRPITKYPDQLAKYLCNRFSIAPGIKLLDIGFGRGDFLRAFARLGLNVAGVDQSAAALKECNDLLVARCNAGKEPLPYPDASFNVVFHKSLLEHLDDPEPLMDETMRILKPGGLLIMLVPDWISQMGIYYDDHTHRRPYTTVGLQDLISMAGFEASKAEIFYQLPEVWNNPALRLVARCLQFFVRAEQRPKSEFVRWSVELMILGSGVRP